MSWVDYDTHARTRPRDDLWGQVRRTVGGRPVPAAQIDMIVAAIHQRLRLSADDTLLDLACGNGALTVRLHPACAASLGVDVSAYLVGVAQERFAAARHGFTAADAVAFCRTEPQPGRFTKVLCYGSLPYLTDTDVASALRALHDRFPAVTRVMLGNLPDPGRIGAFHPIGPPLPMQEPRSDIGMWRSPECIADLAGPGWRAEFSVMPAGFYAAHYRFDACLVRLP